MEMTEKVDLLAAVESFRSKLDEEALLLEFDAISANVAQLDKHYRHQVAVNMAKVESMEKA
jgi:hypothetical protein